MERDTSTERALAAAVQTLSLCRTDSERRELVENVYKLGYIDGGINESVKTLARLKEAA